MKKTILLCSVIVLCSCISACSKAPGPEQAVAPSEYHKHLQTQLISAKPGDVITIPAGTHEINRGLSLNVSGVTLRGEGMDKSILSFRNQLQGAEGLLINASDFTIEDLAIEDTAGDGLKINEGRNIIIRRVRAEWTNGPDEKNGAYGIYPGRPDDSIMIYRMQHSDPAIAMPELGRSTVHDRGLELLKDWVSSMRGEC